MTSFTAKITSEGQIVLPREVSELLGVGAGDSVRVEMEEGKVALYPGQQFDFSQFIGTARRDDNLTASEWQDEMRGDPDERATLREAPPHPNITYLSKEGK